MKFKLYVTVSFCLIVGSFLCSGCANPKKSLGLNRTAPDEFTVISHAPLTLPPDYNITPSSETDTTARKKSTAQTAQKVLFSSSQPTGKQDVTDAAQDKGVNILLSKAGVSDSNQGIRDIIAKEGAALVEQDKDFTDKLVFWRDGQDDPTSYVVDANKETKRIQNNQALGKPVTEGETPYIARKRKSLLDFD